MIKVGQIIDAVVYRVEPYGIFLRHDDAELFVHLPELSWTDSRPANARVPVNASLSVLVLARNPEKDQWIASVKRARPESNPFLEIADLPGDACLRAEIVYQTPDALIARLENRSEGFIRRSDVTREVRIGDIVDVLVVAVDPERGELQLRLKG